MKINKLKSVIWNEIEIDFRFIINLRIVWFVFNWVDFYLYNFNFGNCDWCKFVEKGKDLC